MTHTDVSTVGSTVVNGPQAIDWVGYIDGLTDHMLDERPLKPVIRGMKSVLLELTLKCSAPICSYCYCRKLSVKDAGVSVSGAHVPLELILHRIEWIARNTDAEQVTLLGGEPLLYPHLREVIIECLNYGLAVNLITCGHIGGKPIGIANYEMALAAFAAGAIGIQLSFHKGVKEESYFRMLQRLCDINEVRFSHINRRVFAGDSSHTAKYLISRTYQQNSGVFSTITFDDTVIQSLTEVRRILHRIICDIGGFDRKTVSLTSSDGEKTFTEYFRYLSVRLQEARRDNLIMMEKFDWTRGPAEYSDTPATKIAFRIWTTVAVEAAESDWTIKQSRVKRKFTVPVGTLENESTCPVLAVTIADYISCSGSLLVRCDGELLTANPQCIVGTHGFCNVDEHLTQEGIRDAFLKRFTFVRELIIREQGRLAGDDPLLRCKLDPKFPRTQDGFSRICPSCPFNSACGTCQGYHRNGLVQWINLHL